MGDTVFITGRAAVHKGSAGQAMFFPDVCLCPPSPPAGPIPTPLPNSVLATDLAGGATSVLIEGNPQGHLRSFIQKSTGNEVSQPTGGGVVSHATQGKAYFLMGAFNVLVEGNPAVRHADLMTGNHLAQSPMNTPPAPWMSMMDMPAIPATQSTTLLVEGKDFIKIAVQDTEGTPLAGVGYELKLQSGRILMGHTLHQGIVVVQGLKKGHVAMSFRVTPRKQKVPKTKSRKSSVQGKTHKVAAKDLEKTLSLETGATHLVRLALPQLRIRLPIDPKGTEAAGTRFILAMAKDQDVTNIIKTVKDDQVLGDDYVDLLYDGLLVGALYTLIVEQEASGNRYNVFTDVPYAELIQE